MIDIIQSIWNRIKKKVFIQSIQERQQKEKISLSRCCRLFGISRQGIYQAHKRALLKAQQLSRIKPLVIRERMKLPRVGTRKLYYLLKEELDQFPIKVGRDRLFHYLRSEQMLIKPKKNYTKTTFSKCA